MRRDIRLWDTLSTDTCRVNTASAEGYINVKPADRQERCGRARSDHLVSLTTLAESLEENLQVVLVDLKHACVESPVPRACIAALLRVEERKTELAATFFSEPDMSRWYVDHSLLAHIVEVCGTGNTDNDVGPRLLI